MELKGLPEGVEALELRVPKDGDLVFFHGSIVQIQPENMQLYSPELIVGLLPGYKRLFDIQSGDFKIIKTVPPPTPVKKSTKVTPKK